MARARAIPPTLKRLKELLRYDPDTGQFTWLKRRSGGIVPGSPAGSLCKAEGYVRIYVDGKNYHAHRLAWYYVYGQWPYCQVDHRDLNRANNKLDNLRLATNGQNMWNCPKRAHNTSGYKGVSWSRGMKKWWGQIVADGVHHNLGYFDDPAVAYAAYCRAAKKIHGEFARVE